MGIKCAIRCNQQQFDSVKDRLVNLEKVTPLKDGDYLVNCYRGDKTTNLSLEFAMAWTRNIIDVWDEDTFLDACDIQKTWRSDELEFFNESLNDWVKFNSPKLKVRVKKKETQLQLQQEIVAKTGINIVTCGNCGSTLLHRQSDTKTTCPDCETNGEFPDLNY